MTRGADGRTVRTCYDRRTGYVDVNTDLPSTRSEARVDDRGGAAAAPAVGREVGADLEPHRRERQREEHVTETHDEIEQHQADDEQVEGEPGDDKQVEGEPGDDEQAEGEPGDDEQVEGDPSTVQQNEQQLDAQADKLGKAGKLYAKKVIDILGEDLSGWDTCPLCQPFVPGLILPVQLSGETKEQLRVLIGLPGLANFQQDRFSTSCTDCSGQGRVLTGSMVEGQSTVQCITCKGRGWIAIGNERAEQTATPPLALVDGQEPETPEVTGALPPEATAALRVMLETQERLAAGG